MFAKQKNGKLPFYSHSGKYDTCFLSNFFPCSISFHDKTFFNSEQLFMWKKAMLFGDMITANQIEFEECPHKCKKLGRKVEGFNEEVWQDMRCICMMSAILHKFQDPFLRKRLLSTKDLYLIEATENDKIWGCGLNIDDENVYDNKKHVGKNLLGRCLMTVRTAIQ